MRLNLKAVLAILMVGGAVGLIGCQSGGASSSSMTGMPSDKAITCSKCQVTFINVPEANDKNRVIAYSKKPEMVCAECRTTAENFFKTGQFKHTCSVCGDTMDMCPMK